MTKKYSGKGQNWLKGKTYAEVYGIERAKEINEKRNSQIRGRKKQPISEEAKLRISNSMKKAHEEGRANTWRPKDSYAEKKFLEFLNNIGYEEKEDFVREFRIGKYRVDFFFHKNNLVIEIDGTQHYRYKHLNEKDKIRDKFLKSLGFKVLRIIWINICHDSKKSFCEIESFLKNQEKTEIDYKNFSKKQLKNFEKIGIEKAKTELLKRCKLILSKKKIAERIELSKTIDKTKFGWVAKLGNLWNISHTQVRRFMKQYCAEELKIAYKKKSY